ncbi:GLPGLI family protein [Elizabethkingia meningoseptica]|uniref:GLPGLI family protein n=1 Tax=Elizabethkingia meningoseptica TaxID=238 RepID=UPI00372EC63F
MKFYSILFILFFTILKSQTIKVSGNFTLNAGPYKITVLDESFQNIYYNLEFLKNPKKPNSKLETLCILQLGKKFSKFIGYNTLRQDSLAEQDNKKGKVNANDINQMLALNEKWKTVLVKNILEEKNIFQDRAKDTYQYEEKLPNFSWSLGNETKEILGYVCKKAMTEYRGRKYVAWYTTDIPINNGPYVFQGLPGLIMQIEDSKGHYNFTAIAIDKKAIPIYLRSEEQILHVKREQFRKVQRSLHENPGFFYDVSYDSNGNPIRDRGKPIPYNPIELE